MHVSADASLRLKESTALFQAVLALQPRENTYSTTTSSSSNSSSTTSSTASSDELVVAAARHVLSVLPQSVKYKSEGAVNALTRRGGGAGDSLLVVLVQEVDRYCCNYLPYTNRSIPLNALMLQVQSNYLTVQCVLHIEHSAADPGLKVRQHCDSVCR
jgi:hypothetical protein